MGACFTGCGITGEDTCSEEYLVPAYIDGQPVTQIGERAFYGRRDLRLVVLPDTVERIDDYAFAECRQLQRVIFPDALREIGNYAFYNCMILKEIAFGAHVTSIGYGAFKNCMDLQKIRLQITCGGKNCLNAILLDEFQEMTIQMTYLNALDEPEDEARLVFTHYQYEYVPQIEARQFNWETYGSGESYRVCIRDTDIDYEKYDSVFPVALLEDDADSLFAITAARLCWPYKLSERSRSRYEQYLLENMDAILTRVITDARKDETADRLLSYLLNRRLPTPAQIRNVLPLIQRFSNPQLAARLMDYLGESKKTASKRYEL